MSFLVRWLHVTSVAFIFGGALLIFVLLYFASGNRDGAARRLLFDLLRAFEWGFWAALGLAIATGVGNLGYFGEGLPDPRSQWGQELLLKLGLVVLFLGFSAVRTLAVTAAARQPDETFTRRGQRSLAVLYGVTAGSIAGIVAVAVSLAHF